MLFFALFFHCGLVGKTQERLADLHVMAGVEQVARIQSVMKAWAEKRDLWVHGLSDCFSLFSIFVFDLVLSALQLEVRRVHRVRVVFVVVHLL